jgi:hypothetical protein
LKTLKRERCDLCGVARDIAIFERCERECKLWGIWPIYGYHTWIKIERMYEDSVLKAIEDMRGPLEDEF